MTMSVVFWSTQTKMAVAFCALNAALLLVCSVLVTMGNEHDSCCVDRDTCTSWCCDSCSHASARLRACAIRDQIRADIDSGAYAADDWEQKQRIINKFIGIDCGDIR